MLPSTAGSYVHRDPALGATPTVTLSLGSIGSAKQASMESAMPAPVTRQAAEQQLLTLREMQSAAYFAGATMATDVTSTQEHVADVFAVTTHLLSIVDVPHFWANMLLTAQHAQLSAEERYRYLKMQT